MTVCILSNVNDVHAICVELALIKKGEQVENWHWADFPGINRFSIAFTSSGEMELPFLADRPQDISLWVHRGLRPVVPSQVHPADAAFVRSESYELLNGILVEVADKAFCVNPLDAVQRLRPKVSQLALATKCGFRIPPSLFSNDPSAIRAFFNENDKDVVVKHFNQMYWESEKDGNRFMTYTAKITDAKLSNDAQLSACPAIFQKHVQKLFELRIVFIGSNIFAVKIASQATKESVDWRKDYQGYPPISVFELPRDEHRKITEFIRKSGLRYGSIDMIADLNGKYIFLEINETGQFLWIEDLLPEVPLLDCFAEFLISRDPEFRYHQKAGAVKCSDFDRDLMPEALQARALGHVEREQLEKIAE